MELRSYKTSDFNQVLQLLKDTNLYFEACDTRETINAKSIEDPESIVVAEAGAGLIIGCAFIVTEPWANIIYHMAVDPNFQNKGIGTALLEYGEDLIKERGRIGVSMYVMSDNVDALRLYERKGYKAIPDVTCVYKEF